MPNWKSDYPVRQSEEHRVTRRQFAKFACGSALAFGASWLAKDALLAPCVAGEPKLVARLDEIAGGGYKLFHYPTENDPCILIGLTEQRFVAYSQSCTHLKCPVHYRHAEMKFYCPCHEGFFSAEDGRVLAGPPPRALPRYPVEIRGQEIWVLPAQPEVSANPSVW
ncbi:MAG: Rieske (2Fe-2S) protein [Verrucomicrobiota bacterium]